MFGFLIEKLGVQTRHRYTSHICEMYELAICKMPELKVSKNRFLGLYEDHDMVKELLVAIEKKNIQNPPGEDRLTGLTK